MPLRNFEDGAEIVIEDFNSVPKAIMREFYDRVIYELMQRAEDAFFGDGFTPAFASANSISVKKGLGFQTDLTQASPEPQRRPLFLGADANVLISAPDSVNDRIDVVCVKAALVDELTGSRKVKDAISNVISNQTLVVQKDWEAEILVVEGAPNVAPVAPAVPSGYLAIAEVLVSAAIGISGAGDVTDVRDLLPLGGSVTLNTVGKQRVTAGASVPLSTIISDIDALLKNGYFQYFDVDNLGADPSAPLNGSGKARLYMKGGVLYYRAEAPGGAITPIGSGGGGGGGGANWQPVSGLGPIEDYEFDEKVLRFEAGALQAITLWVKVPTSYLAGRPIKFKGAFYSSAAAGDFKFEAVATLIRKNNDAINSSANQNTADSGDVVNAVAYRMRELSIDLSTSLGAINSLAVSPGDIIKIELSRVTPSGTEDTEDIRFIPSSTEVLFT